MTAASNRSRFISWLHLNHINLFKKLFVAIIVSPDFFNPLESRVTSKKNMQGLHIKPFPETNFNIKTLLQKIRIEANEY